MVGSCMEQDSGARIAHLRVLQVHNTPEDGAEEERQECCADVALHHRRSVTGTQSGKTCDYRNDVGSPPPPSPANGK